jgi:hypothetical protein
MNTKSTETPPVCSYEGSDYQRTFWDSGERAYEDAVEQIALKRLLTQPGKLLLELGAGAGRNTPRYTAFERVVLLDYSRTQLLQARQRLGNDPRYLFVAADIYKLPFVDGLFTDGHHDSHPAPHGAARFGAASVRRVLSQERSSCWNSPTNATSSPSCAIFPAVRNGTPFHRSRWSLRS